MSRVITKAELSRLAGVSRTAVTKICKGTLLDAVVDGGVDVEHPVAREWLSDHGVYELPPKPAIKPKAKPKASPKAKPKAKKLTTKSDTATTAAKSAAPINNMPVVQTRAGTYSLDQLENLTVREVVMRYGSIDGFKRFVESLKNIADYKYREQRVRQQRGELISRDLVAGAVFPIIDVAFSRLVNDVPDAVEKLVIARVESGGPETALDVRKIIRSANSRVLKNVKQSAAKLEFLTDAN